MLSLVLLLGVAVAQPSAAATCAIPDELSACMETWEPGYLLHLAQNPFYLRGDFDGDGLIDYAATVVRGDKRGIAFCWGDSRPPTILGAGNEFHDMDDLYFTGWQIHSRSEAVGQGAGVGRPPKLRGDAVLVEWEETASGLLYWSGKHFRWYQQGD